MENEIMYMEVNGATMNLKDDRMSELCRKVLTKIRGLYGGNLSYVTECRRQVMVVESNGKVININIIKGRDKKYHIHEITITEKEYKNKLRGLF